MSKIVRVKVSYYVNIHSDHSEDDAAFDDAATTALEMAENDDLQEAQVEDMQIIGTVEVPNSHEDDVYEERREQRLFRVA